MGPEGVILLNIYEDHLVLRLGEWRDHHGNRFVWHESFHLTGESRHTAWKESYYTADLIDKLKLMTRRPG